LGRAGAGGEEGVLKFAEDRPFAKLDVALGKLLEIANGVEADHAGRLSVGTINRLFLEAGASPGEYRAAVTAGIERGYLTMHPSGAYLFFTQTGKDLFA
jgi:hypothetical protein